MIFNKKNAGLIHFEMGIIFKDNNCVTSKLYNHNINTNENTIKDMSEEEFHEMLSFIKRTFKEMMNEAKIHKKEIDVLYSLDLETINVDSINKFKHRTSENGSNCPPWTLGSHNKGNLALLTYFDEDFGIEVRNFIKEYTPYEYDEVYLNNSVFNDYFNACKHLLK